MLQRLIGQFPQLPELTAEWAPVRIEPIPGSGELLTVAIALQLKDKPRVISAIPADVAHAIFGEQGASMLGIIATCSTHLQKHMSQGGLLLDWRAPFSGVQIGDMEVGQGLNPEEIIEQALRSTACLSAMTLAFQEKRDAEEPRNVLLTKVRASLKVIAPHLESFLKKEVPIVIRQKSVRISCDYYSQQLAINIAAMQPGPRLGQQFEALTSRICRLHQLKSHEGLIQDSQATEVIVQVPTEEKLAEYTNHKQLQDFRDRFLMAQDIAEDRQVSLVEAHTPKHCAEIIRDEEIAA